MRVAPPLSLPVLERQGGSTVSPDGGQAETLSTPALVHFITFSCYQRMKLLDWPAAREIFEHELERVRRWYGCYASGYVVMPEHVHLLISEPGRGELAVAMQMLKQITSRKLRPADLPRFWQVRYYDFPVWSEQKRVEKLRYIAIRCSGGCVNDRRTGAGAVFASGPRAAKGGWKWSANGRRGSESEWVLRPR